MPEEKCEQVIRQDKEEDGGGEDKLVGDGGKMSTTPGIRPETVSQLTINEIYLA